MDALGKGEPLKLLLETHYPGFREEVEETRQRNGRATKTSWEMARKMFTPERVRWAVANLAPYKAPGVDGDVLLQEGIELLIGPLNNMFRSSLLWATYQRPGISQEPCSYPRQGGQVMWALRVIGQ